MENGLPESKYKVWLSTDGKLTIEFTAATNKEVLDTIRSQSIKDAWQELKNMSAEIKFSTTKVAAIANGGSAGDCPIHHVAMEWGKAKSTGKPYKWHMNGSERCFGHA